MDRRVIEDQNLRDNKIFGQIVGVWPNQEKLRKYTTRIVTSFIVMLGNAAQVAELLVAFFSLHVLIEQLPFMALGTGVILKQFNYIVNEAKLTELLNGIVADWLTKRSEEELNILRMYQRRTAYFSLFYKVTVTLCMLAFVIPPTIPPIMDVIVPLNYTRPRFFVYPSYYFVDNEKYYYPILGHQAVSAFILVFVFIACDLNLVQTVQHACALFAISGHRFKHATDDVRIYKTKDGRGIVDESYAKVMRSIDAHNRAIQYMELVEACHVHIFFITLGLVILVLTVTLSKLASMDICFAYFAYWGLVISQLVHLFFLTIMGQFVIDSNEEIFQTICEARWYNGSIQTQSLHVLLLRKCLNGPKLTGGGFISLNLDSFVQVLKASFSYYTVLKSA